MADTEHFEKPFRRARRTLRHLWHVNKGDKQYDPNGCDGCKEIHHFLTDPNYRGDEHYPVGVESDPDLGPAWKLSPDEMEIPSEPAS